MRAAAALAAAALCFVLAGSLRAASSAVPAIRIDFSPGAVVEATDAGGADAFYQVKAYDPATGLPTPATCDVPAGTAGAGDFNSTTLHYPLGTTTVTCTATLLGVSKSQSITVQDTTPPSFGPLPDVNDSTTDPGGKVITYTSPSATDAVSGSIVGTCSPASGATFPIGSTTVTCTATDSSGNTGSGTFHVNVTLVDTQPPVLTVPHPDPVEATGPSGAVVFYTVTATDNAGTPTVVCSPASGSMFALGTTTVTCTATDGAQNQTTASFGVTVRDTTPPKLSLPDNMTVSSGAAVTFSATATDLVDGSVAVTCAPPSGSSFPLGSTTVNCSATDAHGNKATGSFTVTVQDKTPPVFTNVPSDLKREANGPAGSIVTYTQPTATDDVDGPIAAVTCSPPSGATFPLGTTTVTCTASDSAGNTGTVTFRVSIVDTTPPHLIAPADRSVYATTDSGIPATEAGASDFVGGASATDLVDPHPSVTSNAPILFPVGQTRVTFAARDSSGNTASASAVLTVLPKPAPGTTPPPLPTPPDRKPPADVANLTAVAGDHVVTLRWTNPAAADFAGVVVARTPSGSTSNVVVFRGKAATFVDRTVENGTEYRYLVTTFDKSGNSSAGIAIVAQPKQLMLRSPRDGTKVKKPPKLVWLPMSDTAYYNVQLFRGATKILSAWPKTASLKLQRSWKYAGRRYRLAPGTYRWYVWPGYGARADVNYGELLGSSSFVVTR